MTVAALSFNLARVRSAYRAVFTLVIAAAIYEAIARSGYFPPALMPTLPMVANTLWASLLDGTMIEHAAFTMYRVMVRALARGCGRPAARHPDGRFKPVENFVMPLASALMPIPSLAWVPIFILWFGLGNTVSILIVFYAALFPMLLNTWSGVRAVNPLWLRAAGAMGADEHIAVLEGDRAGRLAVHHHRAAAGLPARLDRGGRRRDAGVLRLGARLGDLRRQGIPQRRRDARRARR